MAVLGRGDAVAAHEKITAMGYAGSERLHPVSAAPFTAALGVTRRVDAMSLVTFEGGQYSVPHALARQAVYVRRDDGQVVITHAEAGGPAEVARHLVTAPGSPRVQDTHYPPAPPGALNRTATPRTAAEEQFLGIGETPGLWLAETAAAGASRIRAKMEGRCNWPPSTAPPPTGHWGRPPRRAGSPTATWPRSSPIKPPSRAASRPRPAAAASIRMDAVRAGGVGSLSISGLTVWGGQACPVRNQQSCPYAASGRERLR